MLTKLYNIKRVSHKKNSTYANAHIHYLRTYNTEFISSSYVLCLDVDLGVRLSWTRGVLNFSLYTM